MQDIPPHMQDIPYPPMQVPVLLSLLIVVLERADHRLPTSVFEVGNPSYLL